MFQYVFVCLVLLVCSVFSFEPSFPSTFFSRIAFTWMHIHINFLPLFPLILFPHFVSLKLFPYIYNKRIVGDVLTVISLYLSQLQLPMQSGKDLEQHLFLVFSFIRFVAFFAFSFFSRFHFFAHIVCVSVYFVFNVVFNEKCVFVYELFICCLFLPCVFIDIYFFCSSCHTVFIH